MISIDAGRAMLRPFLLGSILGALLLGEVATGAPLAGSRHDLSTPSGTTEVCVFCHTPHASNTSVTDAPLWNRGITEQTFSMYSSSTLDSSISGQPRGPSMICLSCHDNVNSYVTVGGFSVSTKHDLINGPGSGSLPDVTSDPNCARCHGAMFGGPDPFPIGTQLTNDHPVSIQYPTPAQDPAFRAPPDAQTGWGPNDIKLYSGWIECPTCHDPHDPGFGAFLRKDNAASAMCTTCHIK